MVRALRSAKIVVNPHGDFMRYGGNMRLFEACGVGALQIADDLPGVHRWFRVGTDLVTYRSLGELRDQAAYYLSHDEERRRIADTGRAHVCDHHTYDHRMTRLVELVQSIGRSASSAARDSR
jgi:spore maturation protein CgeB